jgi:phenylacetate-CoA ligase
VSPDGAVLQAGRPGSPVDRLDALRAAHYAHAIGMMGELVARLDWPRERIDAHRTQALRRLLGHAKRHSPWHRERLRWLDADTASFEDFQRIAPMTKRELMENWDGIVTVPGANLAEAERMMRDMTDQFYAWNDTVALSSGGSSGKPALYLYDWDGFAAIWAGMARMIARTLMQMGANLATLRSVSLVTGLSGHGSYAMSRVFANPANPIIRLSVWQPFPEIVRGLNESRPDVLYCLSSMLPPLCAAVEAGELQIAPKVIYYGGEYLSEADSQRARDTWSQTRMLTGWGSTETGAGTFACPTGHGFHIAEDLAVIEPVDAEGRPTLAGELSQAIYATNLVNLALPTIRMTIDDVFEMSPEPCACGSAYAKVRHVHGRAAETFHYRDYGVDVSTLLLELPIIEQPAITEYQIRQASAGVEIDAKSDRALDLAGLQRSMAARLAEAGIASPRVTVRQVADVPRTKTGKLVRFVPLSS